MIIETQRHLQEIPLVPTTSLLPRITIPFRSLVSQRPPQIPIRTKINGNTKKMAITSLRWQSLTYAIATVAMYYRSGTLPTGRQGLPGKIVSLADTEGLESTNK